MPDEDKLSSRQTRQIVELVTNALDSQLKRKVPVAMQPHVAQLAEAVEALGQENVRGSDGRFRSPALVSVHEQLDELGQQLKARDAQIAKETAARQASTIESALTAALTELGVDKHRLRGAVALHRGSALVDDAGVVRVRVDRGGYEDELEVGAAFREWAESAEGRAFIASSSAAPSRQAQARETMRQMAGSMLEGRSSTVREAKQDLLQAVSELVGGGSIAIE